MNPFKKCVKLIYVQNLNIFAGVMELADVTDSKSVGSNTVWVRVPPPAPNTEAPVGCLCVWLSRTGLEAGGTKRSCGAFCPAGERKQSGRAARSASKGRFERRVPPPAPWRVFLQHLRSCEDTCFLFIAIFSLLQGGEVDCVECFSRLHLSVAIAIALSLGIEFT